jgi:RHS repeat-associated protein
VTAVAQGTSNGDGSGFATLAQATATYDANARKATDATVVGGTTTALTQYSYDNLGRSICTAQRMNQATFTSLPATACTLGTAGSFGNDRITVTNYDVASQVASVVTGYGDTSQRTIATYTYNPNGTTHSLADGNSNLTTNIYDGFDRLSQTQYPTAGNGGVSNTADYDGVSSYDANGNVLVRRLRDGQTISYAYDALNRVSTKTLPSPETATSYTYNTQGAGLTATQGTLTLSNSYDALGRLISEGQPYGTLTYQYDAASRLTRITWPDGLYAQYDHLTTGEVSAIRENGATSGIGVLASYTYDNWGRLTNIARGNGVASTIGYGSDARLASIGHAIPSATVNYSFGSYNPVSQIGSRTRDNDAYAWTGAVNVNRGYTANGLNQFTAAGNISFTYDARGNLVQSGPSGYSYTSENMLKAGPAGSATLFYDPALRLSEYDSATSTRFVYAGSQIASELNNVSGTNTLLRRYVWGPGSDVPVVWYEGTGTTDRRWLHADERGSVVAVSNASGTSMAKNSYDEYGIPATNNLGRFQYTGQAWLPELGLYSYKARIYSPTLGRFMQTDPIGYAAGPNWYNYVGSDPVNAIDPSGLAQAHPPYLPVDSLSTDIVVTAMPAPRVPSPDPPSQLPVGAIVPQSVYDFNKANADAAGGGKAGHEQFSPLTSAEQEKLKAAMNTTIIVTAMRQAWRNTLATGNEYSFFIYFGYQGYYPGYIWPGGPNYSNTLMRTEYLSRKSDPIFNYHTHPGNYPASAYPSWQDLKFDFDTKTIGILQTRYGFTFGH